MTGASHALIDGLLSSDKLCLSRAITAVENSPEAAPQILTNIQEHLGQAAIVGFTGPPGAGKSTLISACIGELRRRNKTIAVIAVDPSSPISGGAILGDRIRMAEHVSDEGVFIRSLASRGHLGGLTQTTMHVVDLMDAAGWDYIILETVGAGQSEIEIAELAPTRIVLSAPGLGDDIQAMKAGILEIADILVVNKADLEGSDQTVQQLKSMLGLRREGAPEIPLIETIATSGAGVDLLVDAVLAHSKSNMNKDSGRDRQKRFRKLLADNATGRIADLITTETAPGIEEICGQFQRGEIDIDTAVRQILHEASRVEGE
jgi:LAO/AO transport system kinase